MLRFAADMKSVPRLWRLERGHLTRRRVDTAHWTTSFRGVIPIGKAQTLPFFHAKQTAEI